jgi:uncharacterized protein YbjQ (UPF0145 family)
MSDAEACLTCGEKFKSGVFGSNYALGSEAVRLINLAENLDLAGVCKKCGEERFVRARGQLADERSALLRTLEIQLPVLPILSLDVLPSWSFRPVGIVTAQSTTGTGLFSDVTSAFTDAFGVQSNAYNSKIRAGEDRCKASLRMQTLQLGGNAVLGADVDYSEVGGQRAMLMVCMTGTAVELADLRIFGDGFDERLSQLRESAKRLAILNKLELAPH